jgi:hypothetical protein
MTCPRCNGYAQRVELVSEEERISADNCVNCGAVFGETLIDYHHSLDTPPEPRPDAQTPVYDPEHRRLIQGIQKTVIYLTKSANRSGDVRTINFNVSTNRSR